MLANKFIPGKTKINFPCIIQPKLDGVRCLCRDNVSEIIYRSRSDSKWDNINTEFDAEIGIFLTYIPYIVELDGEIYLHGLKFSKISSVLKNKKDPCLKKLIYTIYDFNTSERLPYEVRWNTLENAKKQYLFDGFKMTRFNILESLTANSIEEIYQFHQYFRSLGYEGIIIRKIAGINPTDKIIDEALYKSGKSNNLLKYNNLEDYQKTAIKLTKE